MASHTYSTYEAKAKLSEILKQVRQNKKRIIITHRGRPVAAVVPLPDREESLEAHLDRLEDEEYVSPASGELSDICPIQKKRGALKRFLEERE